MEKEIIRQIDNLEFIKEYKVLKEKIENLNEYKDITKKINNATNPSSIISLRKDLYKIDGYKRLMELQTKIRLLVNKINNMLLEIVK